MEMMKDWAVTSPIPCFPLVKLPYTLKSNGSNV